MKIDVHTHTKKCKSGDAPTREISPRVFCEKILSTDVGIVAITNHNIFDLQQYNEIQTILGKKAQVWPGIELDVIENETRGHLLVIVSPVLSSKFSEVVDGLTKGSRPDNFAIAIEKVPQIFEDLNPIYVAHYGQKKPDLSDTALEKLQAGIKNQSRVIKEVTNSISAGIYISHGRPSIYGSDVHDWAEYEGLSRDLPDLRLPVDSFEHFCLLLEKDQTTINTVLDRKTPEDILLVPFDDGSFLKIRAFNDINVIFGPKGTGKTRILRAIAKHYSENGINAQVYESASDRLDELFDTKGKDLTINLKAYNINYCSDEIGILRNAREVAITSLSKYEAYFSAENTNKNAKRILLNTIEPEEESAPKRDFAAFNSAIETTSQFLEFIAGNSLVKQQLSPEEHAKVTQILSELVDRLTTGEWKSFSDWKEIHLLNSAITLFRKEIARKTGQPAMPITTGFRDYAMNRVKIEINAAEIVKNIRSAIPVLPELVGSLGSSKGNLECRTEFVFQNGNVTDAALSSLTSVNKSTQKVFAKQIDKILQRAYSDDLFQCISELNEIEGVEDIKTIYELVLFKRYFALDERRYFPSSGESSMVMLQRELGADKEIYILDEPERSLGNEYINDVIVPLIKERAKAGKRIFISTHDANIAVRTLPYSSIYRCHGQSGYKTYTGNPFSNSLINSDDTDDRLDWKKVSMKTLEGGEEAFGERGKIYGNN